MNIQPVPPQDNRPRAPLPGSIAGVLLVLVGLIWLAGNLGFELAHDVLTSFWPLILVIVGVSVLLQRRQEHVVLGLGLILAGGWLWARVQHLVTVPFWAVFPPTLLVLIGGSVIWRAFFQPGPRAFYRPGPDVADATAPGYVRFAAVLSGAEVRPTVPFEGGEVTAVLGGGKLDLSLSPMRHDTAVLDVFCTLGGVEIRVPPDWDVAMQVVAFMGGCVDNRRLANPVPTRRLIVRGYAIMGGVEIKT